MSPDSTCVFCKGRLSSTWDPIANTEIEWILFYIHNGRAPEAKLQIFGAWYEAIVKAEKSDRVALHSAGDDLKKDNRLKKNNEPKKHEEPEKNGERKKDIKSMLFE